ncbi:DUF1302 domain-containing protein [Candidatus Sulfurimonas marisnigri]|uniref:DUF1302 domain-containing protein n=1 Tax=Candidatus Sulfurimonas marisnigri TaxID=2740405 RepID=A0A7S7LZR6_9BACT|nr:DUF1302 family protein [Candidatus Sulfurimonas marisnigri]QOY53554.1 DUF1302 domain-containing protein [Candidatus Sulfurimonas marisnigri]
MINKVSLYVLFFLTCSNVYAQNIVEDDLGGFEVEAVQEKTVEVSDDLAGFGEEEVSLESSTENKEENIFSLSGNLAFKTSAGYKKHKVDGIEYSGINQAQTSLSLQLDSKLSEKWKMRISTNMFYDAIYDLYSHNNYSSDIKDDYKTQIRIDDAYVQGKINSNIDLKIGRQIVVWGKSDSLRVTDVINPLDNRLPGMTDIEDLRLSVGMAKLDYYFGKWNFSFIAIGENRIMIEAPPRSEFFPVDEIFPSAPNPFLELKTPSNSLNNMQYAMAANGVFSGWDLSFYAAHVLDQKWNFDNVQGSVPLIGITRVVNKINMLGTAINIATGSWLLKSEIAFLSGVGYNSTADEKNRLDVLFGFDYMGIKDAVASFEVVNRHIFNHENQMKNQSDYVDKNEMQTALRFTKSYSNDTLNTSALLSMFGSNWENGGFTRIWVEYEIMDAVSANLGVVDYIGGDRPFMEANKENDRIFADITYSF